MDNLLIKFIEQAENRRAFEDEISAWLNEMEICKIDKEVTEYLETHPEIRLGQIPYLIKQIAQEKGTWHLLEEVTEYLM